MRITAFMLYSQFADSLSKNFSRMGRVQEQLSSGKRLTKPSDDIIALRGAMAYKVSLNAVEQFNRNIDEGISTLAFTESSLSSSTSILNRARELAVSESNDTAAASSREISSYEVQNLFKELVDIANSRIKNKYIFSGYLTSTKSFNQAGVYQGDANKFEIYIDEGIKTQVNVTGDTAFSDTTKQLSAVLNNNAGSGTMRITVGSADPVDLPAMTNASPELIRDTINAPMSGWYNAADTIGSGTLTIMAGNGAGYTLNVSDVPADPDYTTVSTLVTRINSLGAGVEAGLATDSVSGQVRVLFRPATPGDAVTVDVANDSDGNDKDTNGLSAFLHTELQSNLTANALGMESFVINDTAGKRLLFDSIVPNTSFTIEVDEDGNGNFADAGDTDTAGLSRLYHPAPPAAGNLTNSISYFMIMDHLKNSLASNDIAGIQGSIYLLDGALDSVVNTTADVGSRLKYLENQKERLEDNAVTYQKSLSVLEDADIAAVATDLAKIQSTLEAMRISSLKALSQSLFDFMG